MAIPGGNVLLGGTKEAGFYGTVTSAELITGDALATLVGLTAGTSHNSTTDWLKFSYEGKILYSPKRTIRYNLSWNHINTASAVFGDKTIVIGGSEYKVRLWRGGLTDPTQFTNADRGAIGSEWNKLMLPLHVNAPSNWTVPAYGGVTEDWGVNFTDADLLTNFSAGNGSYTWCQEVRSDNVGHRIYRGYSGIEYLSSNLAATINAHAGWRPVLELIYSPPNLSPNINGVYRAYSDGFVKIDGVWRQIDSVYGNVNGVWRKS